MQGDCSKERTRSNQGDRGRVWIQNGDPTQWRLKSKLAGGGALMDVGIYALQACRYLSGEEPVSITAQETKTDAVKFAEVDESIVWTMKFPSGVLAFCSY